MDRILLKLFKHTVYRELLCLMDCFESLIPFLSSGLCVGGFQRAATKAGSDPYLCTKSKPGKTLTPTCCQRRKPATCTKSSVSFPDIKVKR